MERFFLRSTRHGETPGDEQIERFITVCNNFFDNHPDQIIGRIRIFFSIHLSLIVQVYIVHMDLIEVDFSFVHIFVENMT